MDKIILKQDWKQSGLYWKRIYPVWAYDSCELNLEYLSQFNACGKGHFIGEIKPMLRPLHTFNYSGASIEINKIYSLRYDNDRSLFSDSFIDGFEPKWLPIVAYDIMLKWHFDVFGLIDKGLAIDINTLTP